MGTRENTKDATEEAQRQRQVVPVAEAVDVGRARKQGESQCQEGQ